MSKRVNLNAVALDGTNDRVVVSDQDEFSFSDGVSDKPFSLSAWVFVGDITADNGPFITKSNNTLAVRNEYIFKHENGVLFFFLYDSQQNASGNAIRIIANAPTLSSKTWHHVVATYDGSGEKEGLKCYTDGVFTPATAAESGTYVVMRPSATAIVLGATEDFNIPQRRFEERLADICIFNKELTLAEVQEVYNQGRVKNMIKATTYNNLVSWWKMGDDLDTTGTGGIIDYKSRFNGTLTDGASIVTAPALPTDRIKPEGFIYSSYGRTRQPKNVAGDHQIYIHGGVSGNMPTAAPSNSSDGYGTENQRFLHVYWRADQTNTTHTITAWGYSHASQAWAELHDVNGTQVRLTTTNTAVNLSRVFEISGVDKVYFRQSGDALASTDLFAAAASTF